MKYLRPSIQNKRKVEKIKRRVFSFHVYVTPIIIMLIFISVLYLVLYKYKIFNIKTITIEGTQSFVNESDIYELTKVRSIDKNILLYDSDELQKSLSNNFQGAKDIFVYKKLPATLKVIVKERTPLAVVKKGDSSEYFLIDGDGYVLGQIDSSVSNFPVISYNGEIDVGFFLDKQVVNVYFELLTSLDDKKISASSMSISSDYVSLYTSKNIEVLFNVQKNIKNSVNILEKLLSQLNSEGKDVKRVDLRYDKVIVSYR